MEKTNLERLLAGEKATHKGNPILKVIDHSPECKYEFCISVFYTEKKDGPWYHRWLSKKAIEDDIVFELSAYDRLSGGEKATIFCHEIYSVTSYSNVTDGEQNILVLFFVTIDNREILNSAWLSKSAIEDRYIKGDIVFLKEKK